MTVSLSRGSRCILSFLFSRQKLPSSFSLFRSPALSPRLASVHPSVHPQNKPRHRPSLCPLRQVSSAAVQQSASLSSNQCAARRETVNTALMLAWQLTLSLLPSPPPLSKLGASLRRTALRSSPPNPPPPSSPLLLHSTTSFFFHHPIPYRLFWANLPYRPLSSFFLLLVVVNSRSAWRWRGEKRRRKRSERESERVCVCVSV